MLSAAERVSEGRGVIISPVFSSSKNGDTWTHTATDVSGEDASVQAIANAAWTDSVKTAYKTFIESQSIL